jgi:hypothetical protein
MLVGWEFATLRNSVSQGRCAPRKTEQPQNSGDAIALREHFNSKNKWNSAPTGKHYTKFTPAEPGGVAAVRCLAGRAAPLR